MADTILRSCLLDMKTIERGKQRPFVSFSAESMECTGQKAGQSDFGREGLRTIPAPNESRPGGEGWARAPDVTFEVRQATEKATGAM